MHIIQIFIFLENKRNYIRYFPQFFNIFVEVIKKNSNTYVAYPHSCYYMLSFSEHDF